MFELTEEVKQELADRAGSAVIEILMKNVDERTKLIDAYIRGAQDIMEFLMKKGGENQMSLEPAEAMALEGDFETLGAMIEDFGDKWGYEKLLKALRSRVEELEKTIVKTGICVSCFGVLPPSISEMREGGYAEEITSCKCGAIYSGGMTK